MDPTNASAFADKKLTDYWQQVDLYIGGSEHATGHLLYVRFWTKFLKDLGYIAIDEPAKKLINQGMIQGRSNFLYRVNTNNTFQLFVSRNYLDKKGDAFEVKQEFNSLVTEKITKHLIEQKLNNITFQTIADKGISQIHVDVNIVNNDVLDIDAFKNWREEYKDAIFISEENGDYICGHEVEKMSKSKIQCRNTR
jgi:leucyl-tRNA synthetase